MTTDIEKFWSKIDREHPSGCWLWKGSKTKSGYGQTYFNGKMQRVHRVVFELTKGKIPDGMKVCHSCDVRDCCNSEHLWLGTSADNNRNAQQKGRSYKDFHLKGENHPLSKLSNSEREEIIQLKKEGRSIRDLAKAYNVSNARIFKIYKGINR